MIGILYSNRIPERSGGDFRSKLRLYGDAIFERILRLTQIIHMIQWRHNESNLGTSAYDTGGGGGNQWHMRDTLDATNFT